MIGHLVRRAHAQQRQDDLTQLFDASRRRVEDSLERSHQRIRKARRMAARETVNTPAGDLVCTPRGHAHGHGQSPDFLERNV